MVKYGREIYDFQIEFDVGSTDIENLLDTVLAGIKYESDVKSITEETAETLAEATVRIELNCKVTTYEASWGDNGGCPPDSETEYTDMGPDELEDYLKEKLHADFIYSSYQDFKED